ncbi:hypothetical protein [Verrucosispora sp. TAA-831]|uniref:hypothetical protein n=1 Tax=Verrucosispora sp. TAA-831 TaxID=3422227 RepID=UPI003D6F8232
MADPRALLDAVEQFNLAHPVGTWVRYWLDGRARPAAYGRTGGKAVAMRAAASVWVAHAGSVPLADVEPLPEQPDGIAADEPELPEPAAAARRVREYVTAFGDGIYDVTTEGYPLYGRDLDALSQQAIELAGLVDGLFLVWSHTGHAWWGPGGRAYRHDITRAGRFAAEVARSHANARTWPADQKTPPEVVIPAPPLAVLADPTRIEAWTDEQIRQATTARIAERKAAIVEVPL